MSAVLAIDTSTDACSVAFALGDTQAAQHRIIPRAHNQHIFAMVEEVMAGHGLDVIEYFICGVGPGSFTGLRIAASVIQGFAWAKDRPVMPLCSLEIQARSAEPHSARWLLSATDAQIGQLYWRWFDCQSGVPVPLGEPAISVADDIPAAPGEGDVVVVGSGCVAEQAMVASLGRGGDLILQPEVRPHARVMVEWARTCGENLPKVAAHELQPRYVQQDIGWKKLSEQPRRG